MVTDFLLLMYIIIIMSHYECMYQLYIGELAIHGPNLYIICHIVLSI